MEKKKITVFVAGQKLTLLTTESEKYVSDIANKVETTINSLFASSNLSKEKCAVMAALDFCDDEAKARACMNEIKEQIKDYIEDVAKLKEEIELLKAEVARLEGEKKTLLNSKKTMIATKVDIKEEKVAPAVNTTNDADNISADDDLSFDVIDSIEDVKDEAMEAVTEQPADKVAQQPKKNDKKRHEHNHVNPFKERFMKQNDKGYTPVRQYSLFDDKK